MGARGFGQLTAPVELEELTGEELDKQQADDLHAIRERVCLPRQWREVPIKTTGAAFGDDFQANGQVFNCLVATVKTGTVYVWHRQNSNINQTPDYIFSASDTKQLAIAPKEWDTWSFYASGGAAEAMFIFGNV